MGSLADMPCGKHVYAVLQECSSVEPVLAEARAELKWMCFPSKKRREVTLCHGRNGWVSSCARAFIRGPRARPQPSRSRTPPRGVRACAALRARGRDGERNAEGLC